MHVYNIVSGQIKGTSHIKHRLYFMGIGNKAHSHLHKITLSKQQSRSFGTGSSGDCKSLWSTHDIRFSTAHSLATSVFAVVTPLAANFASSSITGFAKRFLRLRDKRFFLAGANFGLVRRNA